MRIIDHKVPHYTVFSSPLLPPPPPDANIFFITLFSNALSLGFSFSVTDQCQQRLTQRAQTCMWRISMLQIFWRVRRSTFSLRDRSPFLYLHWLNPPRRWRPTSEQINHSWIYLFYFLYYKLTLWRRVLFDKLVVPQTAKKKNLPGISKFITALQRDTTGKVLHSYILFFTQSTDNQTSPVLQVRKRYILNILKCRELRIVLLTFCKYHLVTNINRRWQQ